MKFLKLLLALSFIMPLAGCFGNEPNDIAYIVALGFDKSEDDLNYKITMQFAKPTQISGGASEEGGKGGPNIVENIVVEAPNIYAGLDTANHIVSKKFSLYHTKLFVFSQEVAKEGVDNLLETMSRSEEIRPDVYIAVSLGSANEYLTEVKPVVELNPAKYYQLTYDKNDSAGFPRCTLQDFYFIENTNYCDAAVPLAGIIKSEDSSEGENGQSSQDEQKSEEGGETTENANNKNAPVNEKGFEYKIKNYTAGEVAIQEENKSETMGMAIFSDKKMVGTMGGIDSVIYNILKGEYRGSYVTFYDDKASNMPVTVKIIQQKKPLVNINIDEKKINIKTYLESDFYSLTSDNVIEKDISHFEEMAKKEIEDACTEFIKYTRDTYNADILALGLKAKKYFLTDDSFKEYNWREKFKEYEISVETDFKVKRTGLTIREEQNGE
jgi:spore germination protein KC